MTESLVAIFEHYGVPLNEARTQQLVLCPLGHEDHPSCSVALGGDAELWRCHSCGEGGDAITLIQLKEGCDFVAAKSRLAAITGSSDSSLSGRRRTGRAVPGRAGSYTPRYRRRMAVGGGG